MPEHYMSEKPEELVDAALQKSLSDI